MERNSNASHKRGIILTDKDHRILLLWIVLLGSAQRTQVGCDGARETRIGLDSPGATRPADCATMRITFCIELRG
jgi:hypothetical protein